MKKIIAYVFNNETDIERNDSSEVILCEEKVDSEPELQEIIKYHWGLDADEYELTIIEEGGQHEQEQAQIRTYQHQN